MNNLNFLLSIFHYAKFNKVKKIQHENVKSKKKKKKKKESNHELLFFFSYINKTLFSRRFFPLYFILFSNAFFSASPNKFRYQFRKERGTIETSLIQEHSPLLLLQPLPHSSYPPFFFFFFYFFFFFFFLDKSSTPIQFVAQDEEKKTSSTF